MTPHTMSSAPTGHSHGSAISTHSGAKTITPHVLSDPLPPPPPPPPPAVAWNPLRLSSYGALSNSDRTLTVPALGSISATVIGSHTGKTMGKWYWEILCDSGDGYHQVGIALTAFDEQNYSLGTATDSWCYNSTDGTKQTDAFSGDAYGATYTNGDVIGVALDMDAGTVEFYKNNVSQGVAYTGLAGDMMAAVSSFPGTVSEVSTVNFTEASFTYTPPTGFIALT
jgi:hypothetical protein